MNRSKKNFLLIALVILLVTVLIPVISQTELHNGIPLSEGRYEINEDSDSFMNNLVELVQKGMLQQTLSIVGIPIALSVLLFFAVGLLVSKKVRTKVLLNLIAALSVLLFFYLIFTFSFNNETENYTSGEIIRTGDQADIPVNEINVDSSEEMSEPTIPTGISFIFSLILVLLFLAIIYLIYRKILTLKNENKKNDLFDVTDKAIESIQSGEYIPHVIIRCYNQMTVYLKEEMGIIRSASMTPLEFQDQLIKEGLNVNDISQLTKLFERVRYGKSDLTDSEEKNAQLCLKSVLSTLEKR